MTDGRACAQAGDRAHVGARRRESGCLRAALRHPAACGQYVLPPDRGCRTILREGAATVGYRCPSGRGAFVQIGALFYADFNSDSYASLSDVPAREDAGDGKPIGGEAWALALRMLAAIGMTPDDAYSASLACFHVPGSRLADSELARCGEIARHHVALVKPERLLLFGEGPVRALLGEPLAQARGHIHRIEGVRTVATFHPRWLLQRPSDKALAWRDLLLLMDEI